MVVTSISSASRHCDTIWPKRPKPITSTDPRASEKSSGSRVSGGLRRRSSVSVNVATRGPRSMVMAAMAVRMLAWEGGKGREVAGLAGVQYAQRPAERNEDKRKLAGRRQHRSGAERIGPAHAGGVEQQPDDRRLEYGDDPGRDQNQPEIGAHDRQIDAHSDAHEEQGQQKAAERFDVGFQLVPIVGFGK